MRFALDWRVEPASANEADVTVTVDFTLVGAMRLLTPLIAIGAPGRNARISAQMVRAIEAATPEATAAPVAA
jgi:hypothetical protein